MVSYGAGDPGSRIAIWGGEGRTVSYMKNRAGWVTGKILGATVMGGTPWSEVNDSVSGSSVTQS